jgi:AcrR family transcriptional regulator
MARTKDPAVRSLLLDRAAQMLRTRQPVTLRTLVAGTGVSTMAVYTYFGGMDGLWKALRQETFAALGAAYLGNAMENPDLYRVVFDAVFDLEDTGAAERPLPCRRRPTGTGDPELGHRPRTRLTRRHGPPATAGTRHGVPMLTALFTSAGDQPDRCRQSVERGWGRILQRSLP